MNDLPKNWWASKTIWASVLATVWPILLFLSKQFGFDLPASDTVSGALGDIGTVVLSVIAIYGRVTAKAPIAKPSTPAGTASVIVAMIAVGVLAGCTAPQMQKASQDASIVATAGAQIAVNDASKPDLATLQKGCDAFNATVAASTPVVQGGAKTTEGYVAAPGQAFCKIVQAGAVPANADSNSTNWLNVLATTISTVKALAPLAVALL